MRWTAFMIIAAVAVTGPRMPAEISDASEPQQQELADRSGERLKQVRQQLDSTARRVPLGAQGQFVRIYDALSKAEQALVALKAAQGSDVAQARTRLEESTAKVLRLWHELPTNPGQISAKKR